MAWDVMSGVTKTAWDVMSGVTKTAWDVLYRVANLCRMFCPRWQKMAWDVLSGSQRPFWQPSWLSLVGQNSREFDVSDG